MRVHVLYYSSYYHVCQHYQSTRVNESNRVYVCEDKDRRLKIGSKEAVDDKVNCLTGCWWRLIVFISYICILNLHGDV